MKIFDFNMLIGKKLSVMMVGKNDMKESYVGELKEVFDDFIRIDVNGFQRKDLHVVYIRKDQIISFWVYGCA